MKASLAFGLFLILAAVAVATVNIRVDRTIDLRQAYAKVTSDIEFENDGATALDSYEVHVAPSEAAHVALVEAFVASVELRVSIHAGGKYTVHLNKKLAAGDTTTIQLVMLMSNVEAPIPPSIAQGESQLVRYNGNLHFYSPFVTNDESLSVLLPSAKIEEATKHETRSISRDSISYGDFSSTSPFSQADFFVHFDTTAPFIRVTKLHRHIEISHWGNVAVEDNYEITHSGAALKGSFSRLDFTRMPGTYGSNAFNKLRLEMPVFTRDPYYRDAIGNISTSFFRTEADKAVCELRPRFPVFGGWKVEFTWGYNFPLAKVLAYDSEAGHYVLSIPASSAIEHAMVDELITDIVLPEGASHVASSFSSPQPFTQEFHAHSAHLDLTPRQVSRTIHRNVMASATKGVQHLMAHTSYTLPFYAVYREPCLIALALFTAFLSLLLLNRFVFGGPTALTEVKTLCEKRNELVSSYTRLILRKDKKEKDGDKNSKAEHKAELTALWEKCQAKSSEVSQAASAISGASSVVKEMDRNISTRVEIAKRSWEYRASGNSKEAWLLEDELSAGEKAYTLLIRDLLSL